MGNAVSDRAGLSKELWNRDLKKLFSSNKIAEPFDFVPKFCDYVTHSANGREYISYFFISTKGELISVSNILPTIEFRQMLPSPLANSYVKVSSDSFLICSDEVFYVKQMADSFKISQFAVPEPRFIISDNSSNYFVINRQSSIFALSLDGGVNEIRHGSSEELPIACALLGSYVIISTSSALIVKALNPNAQSFTITSIAGASKLAVDQNGGIFFTPPSEKEVFYSQIHADGSATSKVLIVSTTTPITNLQIIHGTYLVVADEKTIYLVSTDSVHRVRMLKLPEISRISSVIPLAKNTLFVIIGTEGPPYLCQHPEYQQGTEQKVDIQMTMLFDFHHSPILGLISPEETSFITIDQNSTAVMWENPPNWWNAPYYFNMFGETPSEPKRVSDR